MKLFSFKLTNIKILEPVSKFVALLVVFQKYLCHLKPRFWKNTESKKIINDEI